MEAVVHSGAIDEGFAPSFLPADTLTFAPDQQPDGGGWVIAHIIKALRGDVVDHETGVVGVGRHVHLQPLVEVEESLAEREPHKGFAHEECEEVPCRQVMAQSVGPGLVERRRKVYLMQDRVFSLIAGGFRERRGGMFGLHAAVAPIRRGRFDMSSEWGCRTSLSSSISPRPRLYLLW